VNKYEYNIVVKRWYPVLIDFGQSVQIKHKRGSADMFTFLTDFSVGTDGSRPKVSSRGKPVLSLKGIPKSVGVTITTMLKKILLYYEDVEKEAPFSEWLVPKYQIGTMLLKETFANAYKQRNYKVKTIQFKV
jgi:hypothetical protein